MSIQMGRVGLVGVAGHRPCKPHQASQPCQADDAHQPDLPYPPHS